MAVSAKKSVRSRPNPIDDRRFAVRLMEHLVVPTFVIDRSSRVLVWNKACERLTGVNAEDVLQTSDHWRAFYTTARPCLADLLVRSDFDAIASHYSHWDAYGLSDFGVSVENWCVMPKRDRKLYLAIDAGPIYDEAGQMIAVVETVRDITAQRENQAVLETLAARDSLTGLANRRSFDEALTNEVRRAVRDRQPLSLLMIDVDCFKAFNDTYGHQKGDECLKAIAQALSTTMRRGGDTAARYGGEEFAVILPNTDEGGAVLMADRVRAVVEALAIPHVSSSASSCVTLSVGSASGEGSDLDPQGLVATADEALYASKRNGRNRSTSSRIDATLVLF